MNRLIFAIFALLLASCNVQKSTFYGTSDLKTFRDGRDSEFRNKEESPLKEEDFPVFKGLDYFPTDEQFRVNAKFKRTPDEEYFQMPTSSGTEKKFVKYGELSFRIGEQDLLLNVYQFDIEVLKTIPEYADLLFVPFKDLTSNKETYGGGRYIDMKTPMGDEALLDFNLAYNPSCAYGSDRFNCPIPPAENFLKIEIRAGEKSFESPTGTAAH